MDAAAWYLSRAQAEIKERIQGSEREILRLEGLLVHERAVLAKAKRDLVEVSEACAKFGGLAAA